MMFYLKYAINSIFSRARQYRPLFLVSTIGVCIMLSVLMVTDGMIISMNEKARQYYGGDLQLLGGSRLNHPSKEDEETLKVLRNILPKETVVSTRYNYDASGDSYYYEGISALQRVIQGVDFDTEKELFSKFTFTEGTARTVSDHNSVILSEPIARKLGIKIGDEITLFVSTNNGYKNTAILVVTGIFQDSSIFGMYSSYMDKRALEKVLDWNEPMTNRVCIYYTENSPKEKEIMRVYNALTAMLPMAPFTHNKDLFYDKINHAKEPLYGLIPLDANVSELRLLSEALHGVVLIIVVLLVVIIAVGISSTFRVIVMKRTVESGTFRALGMKPLGLMMMYFTEVLLLLLSGCILGFGLSLIVVKITGIFNLSFVSGFDIFLTGGVLKGVLVPYKVLLVVGIILVTTLTSVLFTLRKLIHISPVGAITATV